MWLLLAAFLVVRTGVRERGVILDHVEFGRRLLAAADPYAPYAADADEAPHPLHPPYPPSFGLLTAPFAVLARIDADLGADGRPDLRTSRLARVGWALLQVLALCAIARCLRDLPHGHGPPSPRAAPWLLLAALLVTSRYVLRDTHGGGGNLINLALCLLAFRAAEHDRPTRAGAWLGFSLATKPALLWLLPVLWLFGHRRATAWTVAWGLGAALASLLLLRGDVAPWLRWLEGTFSLATQIDAFATPALAFPEFTWMNQSLRCALARYLGEVPAAHAAAVDGFFPGLGWPPAAVAWATRLLSAGLLAWLLVAAHRARREPTRRGPVLAAGLALSLLLSPLSWKAHHVALLPAFWLLLRHAAAARAAWAWVLLVLYLPSCALGEELLGKDLKNTLQSLYVVTAWDLVLVAVLLAARLGPRGGGR